MLKNVGGLVREPGKKAKTSLQLLCLEVASAGVDTSPTR